MIYLAQVHDEILINVTLGECYLVQLKNTFFNKTTQKKS